MDDRTEVPCCRSISRILGYTIQPKCSHRHECYASSYAVRPSIALPGIILETEVGVPGLTNPVSV